ncbi:MAG: FtsW/RodA/SpoVE family cell cycle protein [Rhodoferax sp.]|nr:FtsW/RodA/SpoVE family cell cycle protein [Rhodoferax sp.]
MNNLTNYTQLIKQLPENIIGYFRGKTVLEAIKEFVVLKGDKVIWTCVLLLMTMGILLFFSTSMKLINKESLSVFNIFLIFFRKHLFYVITGIIIILFIQRINYQIFLKLSKIGVLIMMGLLILTIGFGVNEGDAMRKIIIPGIGSFQPAEFAKVFAILDIAASLSKLSRTKKEEISYMNYYFSLAFSGLLILLVGVNSNSAALILIFTLIAMIMISPVPKKSFVEQLFICWLLLGR